MINNTKDTGKPSCDGILDPPSWHGAEACDYAVLMHRDRRYVCQVGRKGRTLAIMDVFG